MVRKHGLSSVLTLLIVQFLVLNPAAVFPNTRTDEARELLRPRPPRVAEVEFLGLRRTRQHVIERLAGLAPGDVVTEYVIEEVRQRLLTSGLFAEVWIETLPPTAEAVIVRITVEEKWTLLALPFFLTSGPDTRGGLFLVESNLFGLNQQLAGAAIIGTTGSNGFIGYVNPNVANSGVRIGLSVVHANNVITTTLPNGTPVRQYRAQRLGATANFSYRFANQVSAGIGGQLFSVDSEAMQGSLDPLGLHTVYHQILDLGYRRERSDGVLSYGTSISSRLTLSTLAAARSLRLSMEYAVRPWLDHRLRLVTDGRVARVPVELEQSLPGRDGFRSLPADSITAAEYAGGAFIWDIPLVRARWGAAVLTTFVEGGIYNGRNVPWQRYWGPGGGLRLYLRQVAIPAVGLDVAYNVETGRATLSFSIGVNPQ